MEPNDPEATTQSETVTGPVEPNAVAQPTQSVTTPPARKRGRPKGSSLTASGVRRSSRPKTAVKATASAAPSPAKASTLNRVINFGVVIAVFVTAMFIQRVVPTEKVPEPKVEALAAAPAPAAPEAPAATEPATTPAPEATPAAPAATAPEVVATTPSPTEPVAAASAPAAASAAALPTLPDCVPPTAATAKKATPVKRKASSVAKKTPKATSEDTQNQLNAGGAQDLDSEAARQTYKATSATRSNAPSPANR